MPDAPTAPPLWPFLPEAPIEEVLEWRTDVLASFAAEQRLALRGVPRETLTFVHRLDGPGLAQATELARRRVGGDWLLPHWAMVQRPGTDLAAGEMTVPFVTSEADVRCPGFVALADEDRVVRLVELAATRPDGLDLAAPLDRALHDPLVAPVRRAVLAEPVRLDRRHRNDGLVTARFVLHDPGDLAGLSPWPSHEGLDVLTDPSLTRTPLGETIGQAQVFIDSGLGPIAVEPALGFLQRRATLAFRDLTASARWRRRAWLHGLRGRQRAFWLPTWGRDLTLAGPASAGTTALVVSGAGDPAEVVGRSLMIDRPAGPLFRRITAAGLDALGLRLTIAAPGVPLPLGTPLHWLTRVRLDADRIDLRHMATRTEVSLPVIEVPA